MGNLESYLLGSIPPAGNQRDELLKQMTLVIDQLEEFNKHLKAKPTRLQQYTYVSFEQEFKRIYSILLSMNPQDSALDPLLSRFGRARVVYSKIERPETYQHPLLGDYT